ncbi:MAG: STAS domain-containing protein, partial [Mycobacterium sp.]
DFARRCAGARRPLVLDFSRLDFLAAQGIGCLRDVADECGRNNIEWALVPGHAVLRLLRVCEPDTRLPVVSSIDEAVQRFSASVRPQALLQLVTKSG